MGARRVPPRRGPNPPKHRGRPLPSPRLDGRIPEGGQIHRLGPLLGPAGETSRRASGRERERDSPSGTHHTR